MIIGIVIGVLYFNLLNKDVKDCTWKYDKTYEFLPMIFGVYLLQLNDFILSNMGAAIITEHLLQYNLKSNM